MFAASTPSDQARRRLASAMVSRSLSPNAVVSCVDASLARWLTVFHGRLSEQLRYFSAEGARQQVRMLPDPLFRPSVPHMKPSVKAEAHSLNIDPPALWREPRKRRRVVWCSPAPRRTGKHPVVFRGYRVLIARLISEGKLVADGEDWYRFATDVAFTSPSAAAAIVAGLSASGPISWCITATGATYKDWKGAESG